MGTATTPPTGQVRISTAILLVVFRGSILNELLETFVVDIIMRPFRDLISREVSTKLHDDRCRGIKRERMTLEQMLQRFREPHRDLLASRKHSDAHPNDWYEGVEADVVHLVFVRAGENNDEHTSSVRHERK